MTTENNHKSLPPPRDAVLPATETIQVFLKNGANFGAYCTLLRISIPLGLSGGDSKDTLFQYVKTVPTAEQLDTLPLFDIMTHMEDPLPKDALKTVPYNHYKVVVRCAETNQLLELFGGYNP